MINLLKYSKNYVVQIVVSSIGAFLFAYGYVMIMKYGFKILLNINNTSTETWYKIIFWILATGTGNAIEHYLGHDIAFRVLRDFRSLVYEKVRQIGPRILHVKDSSNLLNLLGKDIDSIEVFYAHTIVPIIRILTFLVAIFCLYYSLSPILAAYVLLTSVVFIILAINLNKTRLNIESDKFHKENRKLNKLLRDMVKGKDLVVQLGIEEILIADLDNKLENLSIIKENRQKTFDKKKKIIDVLLIGSFIGLFIIMKIIGEDSFDSLTFLLIYPFIFEPYKSINKLPLALSNGLIASDNLFNFLSEKTFREGGDLRLDQIKSIEIKDLSFAYGSENILENINLQIGRGQKIGLYGPSGSGKTTLVRLLMGWYPYENGQIIINGIDLKNYSIDSLWNQVNYLAQTPKFFSLSIRENLRMFNQDIEDKDIIEILEKLNLLDKITRQKEGLDLIMDTQNLVFSSGELQRLDLARALLSSSSLLILDEPLSNLDTKNEKTILDYIEKNFKGTIIIISHRYEAFDICDKVYLISDKKLCTSNEKLGL